MSGLFRNGRPERTDGMNKLFDLSINHKMMEDARKAFDTCLGIAVQKAVATGSLEGSATVRVSFAIHNCTDEATGELYMVPEIRFKAGYSVPMKDGMDGKVIGNSRLIRKKDGGFALVNDQISMDELMDEENERPEEYWGEKQLAEVR